MLRAGRQKAWGHGAPCARRRALIQCAHCPPERQKFARAGDHLHCSWCTMASLKARAVPGISALSLASALTLAMAM